jgi:serine protease Do
MQQSWDSSSENANEKPSPVMIRLSHARRRTVIYAAASVFAIAAALGAASVAPHHAQAAAEAQTAMAQKLPGFAPLVHKVEGAVVSIRVKADAGARVASSEGGQFQNENPFKGTPFERFFNGPGTGRGSPFGGFDSRPGGEKHVVNAQGSGFFISPDGYLVTNNHVAAEALSLQAVTSDGKIYTAKVIGTDPKTDLALLKVDGRNDFPYVTFSKNDPEVGDWVVALGNPFGLGGTVTAGIVSAQGRNIGEGPYDDFLQIDAPVNKGNSGGPAFNQDGQVVGVNTAIYSPSGGSVGIAFAVPSRVAEKVITQLKEHQRVTRGWLGVQIQRITPEIADSLGLKTDRGALVSESQSGSPAEKAGIKSGDVITSVNGAEVKDPQGLAREIAGLAPGAEAKLGVLRSGKSDTVNVKIGELTDKPVQKASAGSQDEKPALAQLGIRVAPASEVSTTDSSGVAVVSVDPEGKGADAGLSEGDIILKVGNENVQRAADLRQALENANKSGREHVIALVRHSGSERYVALPTKLG